MNAEIREFLEGLVHGPCGSVDIYDYERFIAKEAKELLEADRDESNSQENSLTDNQLHKLLAAAHLATPGPWRVEPDSRPDIITEYTIWNKEQRYGYMNGGHLLTTTHDRVWRRILHSLAWFGEHHLAGKIPNKEYQRFRLELADLEAPIFEQTKQYSGNDAYYISMLYPQIIISLIKELLRQRQTK